MVTLATPLSHFERGRSVRRDARGNRPAPGGRRPGAPAQASARPPRQNPRRGIPPGHGHCAAHRHGSPVATPGCCRRVGRGGHLPGDSERPERARLLPALLRLGARPNPSSKPVLPRNGGVGLRGGLHRVLPSSFSPSQVRGARLSPTAMCGELLSRSDGGG